MRNFFLPFLLLIGPKIVWNQYQTPSVSQSPQASGSTAAPPSSTGPPTPPKITSKPVAVGYEVPAPWGADSTTSEPQTGPTKSIFAPSDVPPPISKPTPPPSSSPSIPPSPPSPPPPPTSAGAPSEAAPRVGPPSTNATTKPGLFHDDIQLGPPGRSCTPQTSNVLKAVAVFPTSTGSPTGVIRFTQDGVRRVVVVKGILTDLQAGRKHGFHIHQFGDLTNGCASTGAHFNPNNGLHGAPEDGERHVGDLGNILADEDGNAVIDLSDQQISLFGPCSIIGRAVVVHAKPDDLGKGGRLESLRTGDEGPRIACAIIGRA